MDIGIYKSAASLAALEKWQAVISQNLAASSVPGFKKTDLSFSVEKNDKIKSAPGGQFSQALRGEMPQTSARINLTPGEMRQTGDEFDFAIQGSGFFQVQQADGSLGYTRDGEFHLSPQKTLVTKQNLPVMGEGGPITFKTGAGSVSINADGLITQGSENIGKLPVYDLPDGQNLKRAGNGLLAPADGAQPERIEKPQLVNGALENSNVSALNEMVNLIAVSRAYEASQKILQSHDENSDKAIQTLGNPTA